MANAPYQPFDTTQPFNPRQPREQLDVQVDPNAFGAAIGGAIQHLGATGEQVSNEVFQRALAMQELKNEQDARDQGVKDGQAYTQAYENFRTTTNGDPDQLKGYNEQINQIRTNGRAALTNPDAQKLYDADAASLVNRFTTMGAGVASERFQANAKGSLNAAMGAKARLVGMDPFDQSSYDNYIRYIYHQADTNAALSQYKDGDGQKEAWIKNQISMAASARAIGMSKTDAKSAYDWTNQKIAEGVISGDDALKTYSVTRGQYLKVVGRQNASQVMGDKNLLWGQGTVPLANARDAIGTYESGGQYDRYGVVTPHGQALGKYQVMSDFLPDYLKAAGLPSMTPLEFLHNPQAQDTVFNKVFGGNMDKYGSFNQAVAIWFTGQDLQHQKGNVSDALGTHLGQYTAGVNNLLAAGMTIGDKQAKGKALAGDDVELQEATARSISEQQFDHERQVREQNFNDTHSLGSSLVSTTPDGKLPTSMEQLIAMNPSNADSLERLKTDDPQFYNSVQERLIKNAQEKVPMNHDRLERYEVLRGMEDGDPDAFIKNNMLKEDLPISAIKDLIDRQRKARDIPGANPQTLQALNIIESAYGNETSGGMVPDKAQNPTDYWRYRAGVQEFMQTFLEQNKKKPSPEEIKEMGRDLVMQITQPGRFYGTNQVQFYKQDVPDEVMNEGHDAGLSDPDIIDRYFKTQIPQTFNNLFGKSRATAEE